MLLSAALRLSAHRSRSTAVTAAAMTTSLQRRLASTTGEASSSDATSNPPPTAAGGKAFPENSASSGSVPIPTERKESRFKRTNAAVNAQEMHGATGSRGTAQGDSHAASAATGDSSSVDVRIKQISLPHDTRTQRMLIVYLQRVQMVLHRDHHLAVMAAARGELSKILLPAVKGLDAPSVTLLLQVLRLADVQSTMPIVRDAVAWLSLNGYHLSVPQFVKVVELLLYFDAAALEDLIRSLPQRLPHRDVAALTVAQAVILLTALLPRLQYPSTADAAAAGGGGAKSVPTDAALVELAELLRERCKGAEFVACEAALTAELLRALLAFRASREWHFVQDKEAWSSLVEGTCFILAAPSCSERGMSLTTTVQLLADLDDAADANRTTTTQAEGDLSSALMQRLSAALQILQAQLTATAASGHFSCEFPAPWQPRDARELWNTHRQRSLRPAPRRETTLDETLSKVQRSLLTYTAGLFAAHSDNPGVAEVAAAMACAVVEAEQVAAQRIREEQPPASDTSTVSAAAAIGAPLPLVDVAAVLPSVLLETLLGRIAAQLDAGSVTWTASTVQDAVTLLGMSSEVAHRTCGLTLAEAWFKGLQSRGVDAGRVLPQELLACFTPELVRRERVAVDAAVSASLRLWSVSEVLFFFSHLGTTVSVTGAVDVATVLRQAGTALCAYAAKASAAQLASLVECYGAAQVRNDDFCEAAMKRLAELLDVSLTTATRNVGFSTVTSSYDAAQDSTAGSIATSTTTSSSPSFSSSTVDARGSEDGGGGSVATPTANPTDEATTSTQPVTLRQLTQLLRSFALMEVRQTKPFIDAAPHVTLAANEDQGSTYDVTQLLAAYAKMLVWNYPVLRSLAERLCRIRKEDVQLSELVTAQLALLRMDVTLPAVTERFYDALTARYGSTPDHATTTASAADEPPKTHRAELTEAVMQLSVVSRLRTRSHVTLPAPRVQEGLVRCVVQQAALLRTEEVAEVLLSLARLGEGQSTEFEALTTRTLGLLPAAPPRVMARLAEAYALGGRHDDTEVFTLIAERTVAMRHEMAAVTIASILAAFARAGVRHDRLFIEVIPRVRQVGTYGTPRDVVNVVGAYAAVNLWHYKLFSRLADRAIQLRADFHVTELVELLRAYAAVQMRYDALFTEFAPRIQTLSHLFTPADVAAVVSSYNTLNIPCVPVWKATAARAIAVADEFTEAEATQLLDAYAMQGFYNEECVKTLTARFPSLASIAFDVKEADGDEPVEETVSDEEEEE